MPKRVVDGDALARSDKLAQVQPLSFRAEYAYLLTLSLANGSFECDPRKVWANLYSYNRPDVSAEQVAEMLDEFERVKMLFRWREASGKVWGHWIGSDKPGRLPPPSRLRDGERVGVPVPEEKLKQFVNPSQYEDSATVTETVPYDSPTEAVQDGSVGFGFGSGSGSEVRESEAHDGESQEESVTADMAWRGVLDRCRLGGDAIGGILRDLAVQAEKAGEDLAAWSEEAVTAYWDYQAAMPNLQITYGAKNFFGAGVWRNRAAWRRKDERSAVVSQIKKFDSLEDKLLSIGAPAEVVS